MMFTSYSLHHQDRVTKASGNMGSRVPKFECHPAQCFSVVFGYYLVRKCILHYNSACTHMHAYTH